MNRKLYILFLIVACVFGKAQAQSPPLQQCTGGRSIFAVSGDPLSTFRFSITDMLGVPGGGVVLDSTKRDSIVVQWGTTEGLFKIGVQEIIHRQIELEGMVFTGKCEGNWVYMIVDLRGKPFRFEEPIMSIGPGERIDIPINNRLYKNIQWSDPNIPTQGITSPGIYQLRVEDMYGCRHTDTITVINK